MTIIFQRVYGLVSVQDEGRPGMRGLGIPLGGAADRDSARVARALVGLLYAAPVFEFAQSSAELALSEAIDVAWTGARARVTANEEVLPHGQTVHLPAGSVLRVSGPYDGRFGYLAIGGTLVAQRWRGSVAPVRLGAAWRPSASVLESGHSVQVLTDGPFRPRLRSPTSPQDHLVEVALWPAPETELFAAWIGIAPRLLAAGLPPLSTMVWTVQRDGNRVGVRLKHRLGDTIVTHLRLPSIRSSPTLPGTVQVTPSGELIVSLADGPTMGGYPRLGVVDAGALGRVAQCTTQVRFRFR